MGSSGLRHRLYKPAQAESSSIQSFDNAVSAASAGKAASECVNSRWPILPMWYGRLDVSCLPARSPAPLRRAGDKERTGCKDRRCLCCKWALRRRLCATSAKGRGGPNVCNCLIDEGRPLGTGLQEQVPNHLRRLWSKAMVVSAEGKGPERTGSGD